MDMLILHIFFIEKTYKYIEKCILYRSQYYDIPLSTIILIYLYKVKFNSGSIETM